MNALALATALTATSILATPSPASSPQEIQTQVTSALLLSGKAEVGGAVQYRGAKFSGTVSSDGTFKVSGGGELGPGDFALSASFGPNEACVGADYSTDAETALRSGAVSAQATEDGAGVNFKGGVGVNLCVDFDKPIPLRPVDPKNRNRQRIILVPSGNLLVFPDVGRQEASAPSGGGGGGGAGKPRVKLDADGGVEFTDSIESFCSDEELGTPRFEYELDDTAEAWALSKRLAEELDENPELLMRLQEARNPYHDAVAAVRVAETKLDDSGYSLFSDDADFEPLLDALDVAYENLEQTTPAYGEARDAIQSFIWRTEKLVFLDSDPTPESRLSTVQVRTSPAVLGLLRELASYEGMNELFSGSTSKTWRTVSEALSRIERALDEADAPVVRIHTFPEAIRFSQVVFSEKGEAASARDLLDTEAKLTARSLAVPVLDKLIEPETVNKLAVRHRTEPYLSEESAHIGADLSVTWLAPSCKVRYGLEGTAYFGESVLELFDEEGGEELRAAIQSPRASAMTVEFMETDEGFSWSVEVIDNAGKGTFSRSGELQ